MTLLDLLTSFGTAVHVTNETFVQDKQHLTENCLDVLHAILSPQRVEILGLEPDGSFRCLGSRETSASSGTASRSQLDEAVAKRAVESRRIALDEIISRDPDARPTPLRCAVAPILGSEGCLGVVAVYWMPSHEPTKSEVNQIVFVANGFASDLNRIESHDKLVRLERIIDHVEAGVFSTDREGRISSWNRGAAAIFGWSESEALLLHWKQLVDENPAPVAAIEHETRNGSTWIGELPARTKAGTLVPLRIKCSPLADLLGKPGGLSFIVEDPSERRTVERRLDESQKMQALGHSTGELAHDFGNVLTVIQGYAQFLFEDVDADKRELIERILVAGKRGQILLRQFLALARGGFPRPEVFDLNEGVGEMIPSLVAVAGDRVHLEFDPGSEPAPVTFDPNQIAQVLTILVTNAKEAMPEGGTVAIGTSRVSVYAEASPRRPGLPPGSYANLTVRDQGAGMTSTERARAFEPFFSTKEAGAQDPRGLGLATAYGILKQAAGYIYLSSEPGVGTTFDIYLPMTSAHADSSPTPASTSRSTDQIRA